MARDTSEALSTRFRFPDSRSRRGTARESIRRKSKALLQSVQEQFRTAVEQGLDLEGTRKKIALSSFTKDFGQNDPVREYRFRGWFINPNVGETFKEIKEKSVQK